MYSVLIVDVICYLPQHCYSDASKRCLACTKKLSQTRSSVRNIVNEISIPTARGTESFDSFVVTNSGVINAFVEDYRRQYGSIRIHVRVNAVFTREVEGSLLQRIPAFFRVPFKMSTRLNKST